jgi:hypothetical protein
MWKKIGLGAVFSALVTLLVSLPVAANERRSPYQAKKMIVIRDTGDITGALLRPSVLLWAERMKPKKENFIRYRFDFTPEIVKEGDRL